MWEGDICACARGGTFGDMDEFGRNKAGCGKGFGALPTASALTQTHIRARRAVTMCATNRAWQTKHTDPH